MRLEGLLIGLLIVAKKYYERRLRGSRR